MTLEEQSKMDRATIVQGIQNKEEQKRAGIEAAKDKLRPQMERWVGYPTKNHLRVLLCTLPDILWQGHDFKRVAMGELMEPKKVTLAYKKYIARYHPDKVIQKYGDEDYEKFYIANEVFAALSEANGKFCVSAPPS